jgi:hypothetical protein
LDTLGIEWRKANTAFESVAALTPARWNRTGGAEPERLGGVLVSANFLPFLGGKPQRGPRILSRGRNAR